MGCYYDVLSGSKQFPNTLAIPLSHPHTGSADRCLLTRAKQCCEREVGMGLPSARLSLLWDSRCIHRAWCIKHHMVPLLWTLTGPFLLLQPSVWPLLVGSHEHKKLMGWIQTQPRHITPVPAPLFFHCLVYFLRYMLWYMGELVRLTSLLYLGSWIFLVQACDMFRFFIFLSPTPFSAVHVSQWE